MCGQLCFSYLWILRVWDSLGGWTSELHEALMESSQSLWSFCRRQGCQAWESLAAGVGSLAAGMRGACQENSGQNPCKQGACD